MSPASQAIKDFLLSREVWLVLGGAVMTGLAKTWHWFRKTKRANDFVVDMATNHLPHIYHAQNQQNIALAKIGGALGVEVELDPSDPPPIRFLKEDEK